MKNLATWLESRHCPNSLTDSRLFPAQNFICEVLLSVKCRPCNSFFFLHISRPPLTTFGTCVTRSVGVFICGYWDVIKI